MCSMGTTPSPFLATKEHVIGRAPVGVITDIDSASVLPFGLCQSPLNPQVAAAEASLGELIPQPCMPVITSAWTRGSTKVTVDGIPALDNSSQCRCVWDGTITVSSPGATSTEVQ